jgi:geranylgeranyl diphosphate synthase type I
MNEKQGSSLKGNAKKKLTLQALEIFRRRGKRALEIAEDTMLTQISIDKPVREALELILRENRQYVLHPALISLTCEAAGGNPEQISPICASIVLIAYAFDIHDDIMDQSTVKGKKQTIFGKFGMDIALLAGDALFMRGLVALHKACEKLPIERRQTILSLAENSFIELGNAQAREASLKGKLTVSPQDYFEVIQMKASMSEAEAKIGAILGNGTQTEVEALGRYGRKLGILIALRDDFIDIFEPDELLNRFKNECLPLPILYAFKNKQLKDKITRRLVKGILTNVEAEKIADLVWNTDEVTSLRKQLRKIGMQALYEICNITTSRAHDEMQILVHATLEDLG